MMEQSGETIEFCIRVSAKMSEDGCISELFFSLKKDTTIWLYSCGVRGRKVCAGLLASGYKIRGFVDQRAEELQMVQGICVYSMEMAKRHMEKEDVLLVCLQNGLQQELVARQFAEYGIECILYLPMREELSAEIKSYYRRGYFAMIAGEYKSMCKIPRYSGEQREERNVIRHTERMTVFWCDITHIHSSFWETEKANAKSEEAREMMERYSDVPMQELKPYRDLFCYLCGQEKSYAEYMILQERRTIQEQEKLLRDRKNLFELYEESYLYDMSFFSDAPSVVQWNEEGYFNVCDGMHRIQYLIQKGVTKVPVATRKEDYRQYIMCCDDCARVGR